jgi:hypothetical protein
MLDAVEALAATTRRARPRIAFFHDPNQCLYDGASDEEVEARFGQPLVLSENLRNSASITAFLRSLDPERLGTLHAPPSMRSGQPVVIWWIHPHGDGEAVRDAITRPACGISSKRKMSARRHRARFRRSDDASATSLASDHRNRGISRCFRSKMPRSESPIKAPASVAAKRSIASKVSKSQLSFCTMSPAADRMSHLKRYLTACSRAQHALYILRSSDYAGPTFAFLAGNPALIQRLFLLEIAVGVPMRNV